VCTFDAWNDIIKLKIIFLNEGKDVFANPESFSSNLHTVVIIEAQTDRDSKYEANRDSQTSSAVKELISTIAELPNLFVRHYPR